MVKFEAVAPEDVPNHTSGRRGRVSYPILKQFLESDMPVASLDKTGVDRPINLLYTTLSAYAKNHNMPVKLFTRNGVLFFVRKDMDENGNRIENWQELDRAATDDEPKMEAPTDLSAEEVDKRFSEFSQ